MSYKFQKGDAKLGGAIEASQLTGTLKPSSLSDATTDDIAEGSSARYYTDERARGAVSLTDNGGDGSMAYDSSTGVFTFTGPSAGEVRAHFSGGEMIDIVDGEVAIDATAFSASSDVRFDAKLAAADTDALSEGSSNLYYTDARARGAVSVTDAGGDGSMAYDSSTGVFTFTGPSAAEVRAHFSAGEMIDITDGAVAINAGEFSASSDVRFDAKLAAADSDDLSEGSSNLYYTDARSRAAVSLTDNGGDGSMAYDSSTGVFTYTGPSASEVRAHFSGGEMIDITDGAVAINAGEFSASSDVRFDAKLAAADTGDLAEGSNLYYTDARARAAVSVTDNGGDGSMAYDSSTGVLTYTGPSAAEVRAHFSAGEMIDITDGAVAINATAFSASSDVRFDAKLAAADTGDLAEGSNLYYTEARWDTKMAAADSDDLSEGSSNLYYTDARARAAVSVTDNGGDGSMAYDSSTGVLTYTGPSASEVRAHFSAGAAIDIDAGAIAVSGSIAGDGLSFSSGVLTAQHSVKSIGISNAVAEYGLNFQSGGSISSTVTVTLPKISTADAGRVVMVKVAPLSGAGKVTVACATVDSVTDTIDGPTDTSIDIESGGGAVTLIVADAANNIWAII